MIRKSAMLTFALLLTAATSFGQVKLEHKFPSGKTFTTESIASIEQTLTIAGMGTETKVENITTAESTIGQRGTDGKLPVTEKIKALQITIGGTAGEYRFDSVNPNDVGGSPLEVMRDVHKALMKRVVTTVYGKDNRVEEIKTDSDALANLPEQVQAMAKSQLDPEYLKEAANQMLDILPSKAVKQGDSWERTEKADFGAGQMMHFKTKYTYDGTVESGGRKLDKISSKTLTVEFSIAADSPLPLSVKASDLKVKESGGVTLFDRELGRVMESKESLRVAGGITFEANGQELPSELDLTMRVQIADRS